MPQRILNFQHNSKATPESVSAAKAWLSNDYAVGNANFAYFDSKGNVIHEFRGMVCHAGLGAPLETHRDCVAFYVKGNVDLENVKFYQWVITESFASEFVLATTPEGVVISSDIPAALMQNIAIMLRHVREVPKLCDRFEKLLDRGVPPAVAYPFAFNVTSGWGDDKFIGVAANHRAWSLFSLTAFQKFLSGDFGVQFDMMNREDAHFRVYSTIYGGAALCDNTSGSTILRDLYQKKEYREALSEYRKAQVTKEGYHPPNPFSRIPTAHYPVESITFNELIDFALPWCYSNGDLNVK